MMNHFNQMIFKKGEAAARCRSIIKMGKKKIMFVVLFLIILSMCSCSSNKDSWDNGEFGEIDENKEYPKTRPKSVESLVERKEEYDIWDYYGKIPISISDKQAGSLPDITGNEFSIERFNMNGVSFDINSIAVSAGYNDYVDDMGIYHLDLSNGDASMMVAQIAQGDTSILNNLLKENEEVYLQYMRIVDEYNDIYDENNNARRSDFGGVYTFAKMIEFIDEHPELRKDYLAYSIEQRFNLIKDTFGLNEELSIDNVFYNDSAYLVDYSDWYESLDSFAMLGDEYETKIVVKRTEEGVFAFLTKWKSDSNIHPETGDLMYSPTMLVNFSRNEHWQVEEGRDAFVERTGTIG